MYNMKTILIIILSIFISMYAFSQEARAFISDRLRIFYVINGNLPASTANNVIQLNNQEIYNHQFNGNFWTNSALAGSQAMAKALLCEKSNGGDFYLQVWASRLLSISGKIVYVYLIDDSSNPITNWNNAWTHYGACQGPNGCWPCAIGYAANPSSSDAQLALAAGQLAMGNFYFTKADDGGSVGINEFKKGVFLHELTHTQDNSNARDHLFLIGSKYYNYGSDGTHYYAEVLPNLASGFKESLANFPQMGYNRYGKHSPYVVSFSSFASDGGLLVEAAPVGITSGDVAFANELIALKIPKKDVTMNGNKYFQFDYKNLPVKYIIRNEMVMGMIFYNCRFYMKADVFWTAINSSNHQFYRASSWPVDITFLELCRAAKPSEMAETAIGLGVSRSEGNPYFFPLALCDFFTSFRAKDEAEFGTIFENTSLLKPYIDAYWVLRPTIKEKVGNKKTQAAIESIKQELGFN